MEQNHGDVQDAGIAIPNEMTDLLISAAWMQSGADMRNEYLIMNRKVLFEILESIVPRESELKKDENRTRDNPTFNSVVHHVDEGD